MQILKNNSVSIFLWKSKVDISFWNDYTWREIKKEELDMTPNFEHYITRNIRAFYKRRLFSPIIYLLILLILWFVFPLGEILSPLTLKNASQIEGVCEADKEYVLVTFED